MGDPTSGRALSRAEIPDEAIERFRATVAAGEPGDCWPWTGGRWPLGYGWFAFARDGRPVTVYAHRVAYALEHGAVAAGLVVRHACDNPPCCNPAHLEMGTQGENMRDKVERGRHSPPPVRRGEANNRAKVTDADVFAIRVALADGAHRGALAARYGISGSTLYAMGTGETWPHVGGPRTSGRPFVLALALSAESVPARIVERFRSFVTAGAPGECWPWAGPREPKGYGRLTYKEGGRKRLVMAHRLAYALDVRAVPAGMVIRHMCDNPPCCNPAHLEIGLPADNVRDRDARRRAKP